MTSGMESNAGRPAVGRPRIFADFVSAVWEALVRPDPERDRELARRPGWRGSRARARLAREAARVERNASMLADLIIRQANQRHGGEW
ncbi:MAG TPA: hypothetical protein VIL44_05360 [Micromonospora sp.]